MINGDPDAALPALDRAVMYGDGVFRTMRMRDGGVPQWPLHYDKLQADCQALDILCPARETLAQEWARIGRGEPDCVVKIIVSRGVGGRGYGVSAALAPNRVVLSAPLPQYPRHFWDTGVALHVCDLRVSHQPRLAGIKHLNRLENVLARMEWDDPEVPEGLLLDEEDWVVEGTMSNLFMRCGDRLVTPDLSRCGVAGLQRARILAHAPALGLRPEIRRFDLAELLCADEVFVCNSVIGLWPVKRIGAHPIALGERAPQLGHWLEYAND